MNNKKITKHHRPFFSDFQLDSISDNGLVIAIPFFLYAFGQVCSLASKAIDNGYNVKLTVNEIELDLKKDSGFDD